MPEVDLKKVALFYDERKVYCNPKSLTKGLGVSRLKSQLKCGLSVSAGDSDVDISMLEATDFAIAHYNISDKIPNKNVYSVGENFFGDEICSVLNELRGKTINENEV